MKEILHIIAGLEGQSINRYNNTVNELEIPRIGKPEPWLIEAAASIGLDFAGLTHEVSNYFENHGIK